MKRNLFASMMCAGLTGALLASCLETNSIYNPNAAKESFEANWEKTFGDIDPNQDWNTATRATATVSVNYSGDYTAKIYTSDPRKTEVQAYLLGKMDVKGNQTANLSLNLPETLTEVYVALVDNNMKRIVKSAQVNNGKINVQFGGAETRGVTVDTSNEYVTAVESRIFYPDFFDNFLNIIPENDSSNATKDGVHADFLYKSNGAFTIYAVYKVTNQTPVIGIEYKTPTATDWEYAKLFTVGNIKFKVNWGETDYAYSDAAMTTAGAEYFFCEGVKVDLPKGSLFRFTMDANNTRWYSVKDLNSDGQCHFATFTTDATIDGKKVLFIGGEDTYQQEYYDLNDVVCAFAGDVALPDIINSGDEYKEPDPTPGEEKDDDPNEDVAMPWVLLCEDLGSTDDFDFNDVVFSVSYVAGETTATVTPLAAGGTLETYIMYHSSQVGEEIHAMLDNPDTGKMINTNSKTATGTPVTISVSDLNMESDMGGFSIKVVSDNDVITTVTAPGEGTAPQMICIGGANGITWPTERTSIDVAYPDFSGWGAQYQSNPNWYANPAEGKVIK